MSDHGKETENDYEWEDNCCRPFCFLYGGGVTAGKADGFFDYTRLADCIEMLIRNDYSWNDLLREHAFVEAEDYYSKSYCEELKARYKYFDEFSNLHRTHMQFRAVCTKKDKLIRYPVEDVYVKMPEEKIVNLEEVDKARVKYLKGLCGNYFIDIFNDERYQYCVEAYESIGLVKDGCWTKIKGK